VIDETEGSGKLTKKFTEFDGAVPGLVTEIEIVPAALNKDEGATAVIFVLLTNVVPKCVALPPSFQVSAAFAKKFVPVKVSVESGDPTATTLGEIEAIAAAVGGGGTGSFEPLPPQPARADITMQRAHIVTATDRKRFMFRPVRRFAGTSKRHSPKSWDAFKCLLSL
jgi:hypothetical protein